MTGKKDNRKNSRRDRMPNARKIFLRHELAQLRLLLLRPDRFFSQQQSEKSLLQQALKKSVLLFSPLLIILLFSILLNYEQLSEQNRLLGGQEIFWSSPLLALLFPLFWITVSAIMALLRRAFLFFMREEKPTVGKTAVEKATGKRVATERTAKERWIAGEIASGKRGGRGVKIVTLANTVAISLYAILPLVILLVTATSVGNFFPIEREIKGETGIEMGNWFFSLAALGLGLCWEAYICTFALRRLYGCRAMTAFSGWLFPYFTAIFISGLAALFLLLFLLS